MNRKRLAMAYNNILAALLLIGMLLPLSAEASFHSRPEAHSDEGAMPATITTAAARGIPMLLSVAPDTVKPEIIPIACELHCPDFELDWIVVRANCGQADGKAEVIPVGFPEGTTFGYSWPGGISNTATAEGLAPGVYTVTVTTGQTDNPWYQDCFITTDVIVETVDGPELQAEVKKSTNCAEQNGKAELTVTEGTPPYTIEWSGLSTTLNAAGTTTLNNLMPGSNTVVVTDDAGCVSVIDIDVFEDEGGFGITLDTEGPSDCGETDGSITVNIFGGVSPYTITLNDNPATTVTTSASSYTFSDLFSGTFTVEVEDAWRCEETDTVALSAIDCLPGPWTVTDPACPGGEGIIEFLGTSPAHERYEVRQINSADLLGEVNGDQTLLLQLEPGNYVVRRLSIQDSCICTFQFTIDDPDPLNVQVEVRDAVCEPSGITAGAISVPYVEGGTPPYQVTVNDTVSLQVGQLLPDLNPGSYRVKVEDANGCPIGTTVEVEGDSILTGGTRLVQEVCPDSLIQVQLQPSVIDNNLDYQWSPADKLDDPTLPTPTATIDESATYFVTITDGACIELEDTIRVEILPEIGLSVSGDTLLCGAESTTITASTSANVQVDSINWFQNGQLVDGDNNNEFELFATESSSTFYVVAQTVQGCTDTVFFQPALIGEEIAITVFPEDTTVCRGEPVTLSAVVAPDLPTTTLNWFLLGDEANSLGQQDSIQVSPDSNSQYVIEAAGLCNTVYDTVAVNIIEDDFTVNVTTVADTICVGDSTTLTAAITPDSISAAIEWTLDGNPAGS
ncbi:MAG: hypothetical protein GVY26_02870, partial [Bacteroidetes bacterium]|nr:hypothetical protein [Bacteroidota bacterium]